MRVLRCSPCRRRVTGRLGLSERVQSLQAAVSSGVLDPLGRCGPADVEVMTCNLNHLSREDDNGRFQPGPFRSWALQVGVLI